MRDRKKHREQPDLAETFAELGRELGTAMADLGFIAAGQGAMGWMLQDEPGKARAALADLTDEQRAKVAEAAQKLAELASK